MRENIFSFKGNVQSNASLLQNMKVKWGESILLPRIKIKLILRLGWKCNEAVLFSSTLQ